MRDDKRGKMTSSPRSYYLEIFLVCFASLLLEISYTRLISFKLFYYYTYLIIGLALLGIGSGGVFVAISSRLRRMELTALLAACSVAAGVATIVSYFVIAGVSIDTKAIWAAENIGANISRLLLICVALFSTFIAVGVMIASLFGRFPERINALYFADLLGAGMACAVVVPLMKLVGPPGCIFGAGLIFAVTGARLSFERRGPLFAVAAVSGVVLAIGMVFPGLLPNMTTDPMKTVKKNTDTLFTKWSPVFRVDVTHNFWGTEDAFRILHHDGLWGSAIYRFNGDLGMLTKFDSDERSFPFRVLDRPPDDVLIIGAAGGHEILASLYFKARNINAVELNPVTVSLLTDEFADYTGHLTEKPEVNLVNDDGRSYLARDDTAYDLIFFVAPDSYSAMNAATSGAFVLTESYLYTAEMIVESLEHLTDDGVVCMQFGEFAYDTKPNRTARYVATAREALHSLGIDDHGRHMLVATSAGFIPVSTILLKRTPFTDDEIERFVGNVPEVKGAAARYAPGRELDSGPVNEIITLDDGLLVPWFENHRYDVSPITDDSPFFWHFARFSTVLDEFGERVSKIDTEDAIGERLLLLLLAVSIVFASVLLLLPFVAIRKTWAALPRKPASALYFSALGLGFMFFEVSLIQKLTLFLGYPTYSLTVTLMSILIFTGLGSLLTGRYQERRNEALLVLLGVLAGLTVFYQFGIEIVTDALLPAPLAVRIFVAFCFLAPLGLCLGAFMPLGLTTLSRLTDHRDEYIAWGWAVNGFFSVIGSVLTTMLSMTFGFRVVLMLGLGAYALAVVTLRSIPLLPGSGPGD